MVRTATALVLVAVVGFSCGSCFASAPAEALHGTQKYYDALVKRPEPGYLFDRFYNAWLDQASAESLQEFLQQQSVHGDYVGNRLLLAFWHTKQGDDATAITEIDSALKRDPNNASAWYFRAQTAARLFSYEAAIANLRQAKTLKPTDALAVSIDRLLGAMLLRSHRTEEAIAVWQLLLTANPDDEELGDEIVELQTEEGLFTAAAATLESLIQRSKDPYAAITRRIRLGDLYQRAGQRQKAIDTYVASLRDAGADSWLEHEILSQIEQAFRNEDDLAGLKKQYAALIAANPNRVALLRQRCRLLVDLGENDEALKSQRRILELTPGNRDNQEEYVELLTRIGQHDAAVKELRALCQQYPTDSELYVRLARALHQTKQAGAATEAVRQYVRLADRAEYTYLRAARMVEAFGDKDGAAAFYRDLIAAFPNSVSAQEAYAAFLYANNHRDEAVAIWRKLMQSADSTHAMSIARALDTRGEDALTLELLESRIHDFGKDWTFLGQLTGVATRMKKYDRAIAWGKKRVAASQTSNELEEAIGQTVAAARLSNRVADIIVELAATADRKMQTTCLLAELYESVGESKRADELLQQATATGNPLAVQQQIRLSSIRGDWASAAEATRRLLQESHGNQGQNARMLVEFYERDARVEDALKWVETWKRLAPGTTAPWLAEARLLRLEGRQDAALASLQKAALRFEDDDDLRGRLGQAYREAGRPRDAERVLWQRYEKAKDASIKLRWAAELAKLAQEEGTLPRLIDAFRQRSRDNRQSIIPLLALAEVYRIADSYESHREALLAAAKIKPDDVQLLSRIVRLEETEGDWKAAIATLERAAKLDKTDRTRQKIARLHLEYGNRDRGFALLRELVVENIGDARTLGRAADTLCSLQEWEWAIELLQTHVAEHPADYQLRYLLGVAYEELGRTSEAIAQFVPLAAVRDASPQATKSASQAATGGSYSDMLRQLLPAEAYEWYELQRYRHAAYAYRQNRSSGGGSVGVSVGSGSALAPTADTLRPCALAHLSTLAARRNESQQAALVAELKARGIGDIRPLIRLAYNRGGWVTIIEAALREDPSNESLLALFVALGTQQKKAERAPDLARAFKLFQHKHPDLAVMAAAQAAAASSEYGSLFDEGMALGTRIEHPNPLALMCLARALGGVSWSRDGESSAISADQAKKAVGVLVRWYPKTSQDNSSFGAWTFFWTMGAVRASEPMDVYIALLDQEVTRWQNSVGSQGGQPASSTSKHGPNSPPFDTITFPPEELTHFPANVSKLLASPPDSTHGRLAEWQPANDAEAAHVAELIHKVTNPTLRILLANRYRLKETLDATLREELARRPPQLDIYLLAAGKAHADGRFEEATQLFDTARRLATKEDVRRQIDATLVAAAVAAQLHGKSSEITRQTGCSAALRLRRQRLDQPQRVELIAAMEVLGLADEAKQLDRRAAADVASHQTAPRGLSVHSPTASTASKPTGGASATSGSREIAIRAIVRRIQAASQQQVGGSKGLLNYQQELRQLATQVKQLAAADDVKKQLANNPGRQAEYAIACELADDRNETRRIYERLLQQRGKDDAIRMRLLRLLVLENAESQAIEPVATYPGDAYDLLGQALVAGANDDESPLADRLRCVEIGLRHLDVVKPRVRSRADVQWTAQLAEALARTQFDTTTRTWLPSLYRTESREQSRVTANEKADRRARLHRELCVRMADLPGLDREAFHRLLAAAEVFGRAWPNVAQSVASESTDSDERRLTDWAEKLLLSEARQSSAAALARQHASNSYFETRYRKPEEYLAGKAWRSGDCSELESNLLPKLATCPNRQPQAALRRLMRLYQASPEQFLDVARDIRRETASLASSADDSLLAVVSVSADRRLNVELQPLLLDAVREEVEATRPTSLGQILGHYAESLTARGNVRQAEKLLEAVAEVYLGPVTGRVQQLELHCRLNQFAPPQFRARARAYSELLSQLARRTPLLFIVLAQVEGLPNALLTEDLAPNLHDAYDRAQSSPTEFVAMLETSPWLSDADQFRVLPLGQHTAEWPLAAVLSDRTLLSDERWNPFWAAISERQATRPTLGGGLLLAARAQQSEKMALPNFVASHQKEIERLPAKVQADLHSLVLAIAPPETPK